MKEADLDTAVRPVIVLRTVGVPGWLMPDVAILDLYGLNDYVVARNPVPASRKKRMMAHERISPPGYLMCYRPNLRLRGKLPDLHMGGSSIQIAVRRNPLTDDVIRACDRRDWIAQ